MVPQKKVEKLLRRKENNTLRPITAVITDSKYPRRMGEKTKWKYEMENTPKENKKLLRRMENNTHV